MAKVNRVSASWWRVLLVNIAFGYHMTRPRLSAYAWRLSRFTPTKHIADALFYLAATVSLKFNLVRVPNALARVGRFINGRCESTHMALAAYCSGIVMQKRVMGEYEDPAPTTYEAAGSDEVN